MEAELAELESVLAADTAILQQFCERFVWVCGGGGGATWRLVVVEGCTCANACVSASPFPAMSSSTAVAPPNRCTHPEVFSRPSTPGKLQTFGRQPPRRAATAVVTGRRQLHTTASMLCPRASMPAAAVPIRSSFADGCPPQRWRQRRQRRPPPPPPLPLPPSPHHQTCSLCSTAGAPTCLPLLPRPTRPTFYLWRRCQRLHRSSSTQHFRCRYSLRQPVPRPPLLLVLLMATLLIMMPVPSKCWQRWRVRGGRLGCRSPVLAPPATGRTPALRRPLHFPPPRRRPRRSLLLSLLWTDMTRSNSAPSTPALLPTTLLEQTAAMAWWRRTAAGFSGSSGAPTTSATTDGMEPPPPTSTPGMSDKLACRRRRHRRRRRRRRRRHRRRRRRRQQ
jgi:hypothetical protein